MAKRRMLSLGSLGALAAIAVLMLALSASIPVQSALVGTSSAEHKIPVPAQEPYAASAISYNNWIARAAMPTGRTAAAAVAQEGKIWVLGGWKTSATLATTEVYEPLTDRWASRPICSQTAMPWPLIR